MNKVDEFSKIKRWNTNQQSAVWKQEMGVLVDIGDDAAVTHHEGLQQEY